MLNEMKKTLQTLEAAFGAEVFEQPGRFKSAINDVEIDLESKKVKNLLCIAVCEMKAYTRLKEAFAEKDSFAVDNISGEMSSDFMIDKDISRTVIECVAGLLGYKPSPGQPAVQAAPTTTQIAVNLGPKIGSILPFGDYQWRVLEEQNGKALILSENIIEEREYNNKDKGNLWETCALRSYLNGAFYNAFDMNDKTRIAETRVINNKNPWFGKWYSKGGTTMDRVFLLSLEEVVKYLGDSGRLKDRPKGAYRIDDKFDSARIATDQDGEALAWWLRSPGRTYSYHACATCVTDYGNIDVSGWRVTYNQGIGVRPALWLNL